MSDRSKTWLLLGVALAISFPFVFCGPGSEDDSFRVVRCGEYFIKQGIYRPSRSPGFPVEELSSAFLYALGGAALANAATLCLSLVAVYSFLGICQVHQVPHRFLLGSLLISQPFYWRSSACVIDYLWAVALFFAGYLLICRQRYLVGGVLVGLAVGARLSTLLLAIALPLAYILARSPQAKKVFGSMCLAAAVSILCYIPSFVSEDCSLRFLTKTFGDIPWMGYVGRFVYKLVFLGTSGFASPVRLSARHRPRVASPVSRNSLPSDHSLLHLGDSVCGIALRQNALEKCVSTPHLAVCLDSAWARTKGKQVGVANTCWSCSC